MIIKILKRIKFYLIKIKYSKKNNLSKVFTIGKKVTLENCTIGFHSRVAEYASIKNTIVGDYSALGRYSKIINTEIGKFCAISWDTTINAISHPTNHMTINAFPYVPRMGNFVKINKQKPSKVIIKNDVWIGANSVVMPGITIGNGAIIGSGAVVTKDVPDYAIVAGVPAKIIKYRFEDGIIKELLNIKWWDWEREKIENNIHIFQEKLNLDMLKKIV